jgi:hypothetical protein
LPVSLNCEDVLSCLQIIFIIEHLSEFGKQTRLPVTSVSSSLFTRFKEDAINEDKFSVKPVFANVDFTTEASNRK